LKAKGAGEADDQGDRFRRPARRRLEAADQDQRRRERERQHGKAVQGRKDGDVIEGRQR
jgi:hypothetical protein